MPDSISRYRSAIVWCLLLLLPGAQAIAQSSRLKLHLDPFPVSTDGHVRLDWNSPEHGLTYVVERAPTRAFVSPKEIYRGPDLATFVSGLRNGSYFFRVKVAQHPWTTPVQLTVAHHSLTLAIALFIIGAVVFLLTVGVVVKGAYYSDRQTTDG